MSRKWPRRVLSGLDLFLGLTAVAGGIGLMAGWIAMPTRLLAGSPFSDYTVPGLLLMLVVGIAGLTASRLTYVRIQDGVLSSVVAAGAITVFEIVEWAIIGFNPLQVVYLVLGATIFATAAWIDVTNAPIRVRRTRSTVAHR
jgi:hypothetical protein